MGETFAGIVAGGPLLLGLGVAVIAGLVSFLSPCVLPLIPGYLAYVTGLSGADVQSGQRRGQVLAGTGLFITGFGMVFVTMMVIAAQVGQLLREHQRALEIGGGVLMLLFAAAMLGLVPGMTREVRTRRLPAAGLVGAPVFGAVFALSWLPCIGPTLGAVLALGAIGGEPGRAAVLASGYTVGIGLPLVAFGLGFRRLIGTVDAIRRNSVWIMRAGAILLALVGLALLTGAWDVFVSWLRTSIEAFEVVV